MDSITPTEAFIRHVEPLSHIRRCATVVELGRSVITSSESDSHALQTVIAELGASSQVHYHRLLAACALCGAFAEARKLGKSVPVVLLGIASSLLADTSPKVSSMLVEPLLLHCWGFDQQRTAMATTLLKDSQLHKFKRLLSRLAQARQMQVLQQLYRAQTLTDATKVPLLLGSLGPEVLEKLPEEEQCMLDSAGLRLLCRLHPRSAVLYLTSRVQGRLKLSKPSLVLLRELVTKAFVFLATRGSLKHGLDLFTSTAHLLDLDRDTLKHVIGSYYLSAFPVDIGEYLLVGDGRHILETLSPPLLCLMSRRGWRRLHGHTELFVRMLHKKIFFVSPDIIRNMPLATRRVLFSQGYSQMEDRRGIVDFELIRSMPIAAERAAVARRLYNHSALRNSPTERLTYLSFFPFPEVLKKGAAFVANEDVELRSCIIREGVASLEYYPEHLPAVLEFCVHRLKEQDNWRRAMFEAWAALSIGFWGRTATYITDEALQEVLMQLIQAAYDAKDVSYRTTREIEFFLSHLLGPHTSFAVRELGGLIRRQKEFNLFHEGMNCFLYLFNLYPRALPVLAAELITIARDMLGNGDASTGIQILSSLLENAKIVKALRQPPTSASRGDPSIEALLRDTLRAGLSIDVRCAEMVLALYIKIFPEQVSIDLPAIISDRKDWVDSTKAQLFVCNALQGSLLDSFVDPITENFQSRFRQGNRKVPVRVCMLPMETAYRWTEYQQVRYAQSCLQVLYTPGALSAYEGPTLIKCIARLPSISCTTSWTAADGKKGSLATLATEEHPEHGKYLMGFAFQALHHLRNDPEAKKILLNAMKVPDTQGDALRALSTSLQCSPTIDVLRILEPILTGGKVAPQREALRVLGAKRDDLAYARLLHFAAEHHLPMPAAESEPAEDSTAPSAAAGTLSVGEGRAQTPMHRDVRAALVRAFFNFLDKPQVWWYYTSIVTKDYEAVQSATDTAESLTVGHDIAETEEEDESTSDSGELREIITTPSSAACKEMTKVRWNVLRRSWQRKEYLTLLRRLLRHPLRDVRVATLEKLATVPPYEDMALCKVVSAFLEVDTETELSESALKCMLACTAEEAPAFITASIDQIKSDVSMKEVTASLLSIVQYDAAPEKKTSLAVVKNVVERLIATRRQPAMVIPLICELSLSEWLSYLTTMDAAQLIHPGAATAVIKSVNAYSAMMRDTEAAEHLEEKVLRNHRSAFMRRLGLAILLATCEGSGWNERRKTSLAIYAADSDLWVSSDARLVLPK